MDPAFPGLCLAQMISPAGFQEPLIVHPQNHQFESLVLHMENSKVKLIEVESGMLVANN